MVLAAPSSHSDTVGASSTSMAMPGNQNLRLQASLSVNSSQKVFGGFASKNWKVAALALRDMIHLATRYAKENVEEGKGPGPHPHHSWHIDTGNLAKKTGAKFDWSGGARMVGYVYCDAVYGVYLEAGWKTPKGTFYRYPWLKPAYIKAGKRFKAVFQDRWSREVRDIETSEQVMNSGQIDVYGKEAVLEMLKPLEGWKDFNPNSAGLTQEAHEILTAGEIGPEEGSTPHGVRRRGRNVGKSLTELAEKANRVAQGKKRQPTHRHDARHDNATRRKIIAVPLDTPHEPHKPSTGGTRGGIRELGRQGGIESKKKKRTRKKKS